MRTERNPFRGLGDWRVSQLIDACGSGRKGLESGFPMQIRSVPPFSLRGIAAAAAFAAGAAARAEVPRPCPARAISVADGQVEIVHHVDRKAAYHTCFACDDLAAADWRAVAASRATAALDYDVCSNGLARVSAEGAPRRFFRIESSYEPFAEGAALPRAPVRADLEVPLSRIEEKDGDFDASSTRRTTSGSSSRSATPRTRSTSASTTTTRTAATAPSSPPCGARPIGTAATSGSTRATGGPSG